LQTLRGVKKKGMQHFTAAHLPRVVLPNGQRPLALDESTH
jgi:hypothetical protein